MIFWLFTLQPKVQHTPSSLNWHLTRLLRAIMLPVSVLIAVYVISVMRPVTWAGARHRILLWHPPRLRGLTWGCCHQHGDTSSGLKEINREKPETQRGGASAVKTTLKNVLNYWELSNTSRLLINISDSLKTAESFYWKYFCVKYFEGSFIRLLAFSAGMQQTKGI